MSWLRVFVDDKPLSQLMTETLRLMSYMRTVSGTHTLPRHKPRRFKRNARRAARS